MPPQQPRHWQQAFQQWVMHTTSSLDDIFDAGVRRLRKRIGCIGVPQIQPYRGYASKDTIRLHGRVLTNPPLDLDIHSDRWWQNLSNTMQRFASDEVPNAAISGFANGETASTFSDAEGYFYIDLPRDRSRSEELFWSPAELRIENSHQIVAEASATTCKVMFVPAQAKYGIISDIDDTILYTGATDIATMAKLTFFGNARTRAPLDGVANLYELMQCQGDVANPETNPIFYVSSSPWNLYDLLEDFLELNAIPSGPLLLRDLGFDRNKFLKSGHDHKLDKVRSLMDLFDEIPFVLFGDSGQEDARLYAAAAEEFGSRIIAGFIRDIDPHNDSHHDQKVDAYIQTAAKAGVPIYRVQDSTEAAERAINHGLLPPQALDEVQAATQRDRQRDAGILQP